MDDIGYESPDSDGHGSIPSPNSTFDYTAMRNDYDSRFPSSPPDTYSATKNHNGSPLVDKANLDGSSGYPMPLRPKSGNWFTHEHGSSPRSSKFDDRSSTSLSEPATASTVNGNRSGRMSSFSEPAIGEEGFDDDSIVGDDFSRPASSDVQLPDPAFSHRLSFMSSPNSLTGLSKKVSVRKHRSGPFKSTETAETGSNLFPLNPPTTPMAKRAVGGLQQQLPATPASDAGPELSSRPAGSPVADLPSLARHTTARSPRRSASSATSDTAANEVQEGTNGQGVIHAPPGKTAYPESLASTAESVATTVTVAGTSEQSGSIKTKINAEDDANNTSSKEQMDNAKLNDFEYGGSIEAHSHSHRQSALKAGQLDIPLDTVPSPRPKHLSSPTGSSVLPKYPYSQPNPKDTRQSSRARQVSVSSPSGLYTANACNESGNPNSLLSSLSTTESQYAPKVRTRAGPPESPPRSLPTEPVTEQLLPLELRNGTQAPPNTTVNTPSREDALAIPSDFPKRVRSQSDPMDKKYSMSRRGALAELLFTPTRVPRRRGKIPFSKEITEEFDQRTASTDDVFGPPQPDRNMSFSDSVRIEHLEHQNSRFALEMNPDNVPSGLVQALSAGHPRPQPQFDSGTITSTITSTSATTIGTRTFNDGTLRRRVKLLESQMGEVLQSNYKTEAEYFEATNRAEELQNRYDKVIAENADKNRTIQALQQRIETISRTPLPASTELDPRTKPSQDQSETLAQLYLKISTLETKISQMRTTNREQLEEKESVIYQLRGALAQADRTEQNRIQDLERLLRAAREDIEIRDAEVRHLQGELDDLANLMPVDQSSRMMFEDPNSDVPWLNEKSIEFNSMIEESMNDIITELHGDLEREDADQAAEDAEMSLRKLAKQAGYPDMDKISLAAFGIRHMRDENTMFRRLLQEGQEREKQLRLASDDLMKRYKIAEEHLKQTEQEADHIQEEFQDAQDALRKETELAQSLRASLDASSRRMDSINKTLEETKKQVVDLKSTAANAMNLESELQHLRSSHASSQGQLNTVLTRIKELESERDAHISELAVLRADLASTRQREDLMVATVDEYAKKLADLEAFNDSQITEIEAAEGQIRKLRQQLTDERMKNVKLMEDITAANAVEQSTRQRLGAIEAGRNSFEQEVVKLNNIVSALRKEKAAADYNRQKAESDRKLARDKLDAALRELSEKETAWKEERPQLELNGPGSSSRVTSSSKITDLLRPYERALTMIAAEVDESSIPDDGDEEMHELVDTLSHHTESGLSVDAVNKPKPELVALIIHTIRGLYKTNKELDEKVVALTHKSERLKNGIRTWHEKQKGRDDKLAALRAERDELLFKMKAERRANDEKIGNLILALRRPAASN